MHTLIRIRPCWLKPNFLNNFNFFLYKRFTLLSGKKNMFSNSYQYDVNNIFIALYANWFQSKWKIMRSLDIVVKINKNINDLQNYIWGVEQFGKKNTILTRRKLIFKLLIINLIYFC